VSWSRPDNGGSPITSFEVVIKRADGQFETATCAESLGDTVSYSVCTVTIAELTAAPYLLSYGSSIYAKVTALNIYGPSIQSLAGNGAVILTVPDKPVNLADNEAMTSAT
jgi:hypothetical protein